MQFDFIIYKIDNIFITLLFKPLKIINKLSKDFIFKKKLIK